MKLFKISQNTNFDWETYDSAVVAAESARDAALIHPSGEPDGKMASWAPGVRVEYIGEAAEGIKAGTVICASYNSG